jgi:hypothetical protein
MNERGNSVTGSRSILYDVIEVNDTACAHISRLTTVSNNNILIYKLVSELIFEADNIVESKTVFAVGASFLEILVNVDVSEKDRFIISYRGTVSIIGGNLTGSKVADSYVFVGNTSSVDIVRSGIS